MNEDSVNEDSVPTVPREYAEELAAHLDRTRVHLADALKRNREMKAALLTIHRPRRYGRGGYGGPMGTTCVRCIACAENGRNGLRRADWPCPTARALGVEE